MQRSIQSRNAVREQLQSLPEHIQGGLGLKDCEWHEVGTQSNADHLC